MTASGAKEPVMPWQEVSVVSRRAEFVALAVQDGANVRALCRRVGSSHLYAVGGRGGGGQPARCAPGVGRTQADRVARSARPAARSAAQYGDRDPAARRSAAPLGDDAATSLATFRARGAERVVADG